MASSVATPDSGSGVRQASARDGWRAALLPLVMCLPFFVRRIHLLLTPLPLRDFMTYWSAARLFVLGHNPYSVGAMSAMERSLGWTDAQPQMLLNSPWSLLVVAPLGLLPFQVAHYLFVGFLIALEIVCSLALWRYFGGARRQQWIALVILATFTPAATAEHMGQVTPLILAGITGFLFALRGQRYVLAGACLLLFGLKPHLLYLVLLAVLLWSIQNKKWMVPVIAAVGAAAASLAAIAFNRNVLSYFHSTVQAAVDTPCGVGGALRAIFGAQHTWLQFLPSIVGLGWFAVYWMRHRRRWTWEERLPLLLLVSIGSAPYFWAHDFVLGLPAILALAIQVGRARAWLMAGAIYLLVQIVIVDTDDTKSKVWIAAVSLLWIVLYEAVLALCCAPGGEAVGDERTAEAG